MSMSAPKAIEPVRRAFTVLELLNRQRSSTISRLCELSGLPQPTITRMLETLIALGYVARISHAKGYRITDGVMRLAAGIRFVDLLVDAAVPRMDRFTRRTGWPLYLGTISSGTVSIRYSTAPLSPLSFESTAYHYFGRV
jgi:IclR family mhp operon transcriptional activator